MSVAIVRKLLASPFPIIGLWLLGGVLTIAIPAIKFNGASDDYYRYQGAQVEYELNQRAYENAQKAYQEQQNGNGYQYNQQGNGEYQYDISSCKWYQGKCRQQAYQMWLYQQNNDRYREQLPNWYINMGGQIGDDEMNRAREEQGLSSDEAPGPLKFVHRFTIFLFVALLAYGAVALYYKQFLAPLFVAMGVFGVMSALQIILLTQGVIRADGREMEQSIYGFYGQLGVLMVYANYGYFWFSIAFGIIFGAKTFAEYKLSAAETTSDEAPAENKDESYKSMA